MTVRLAGLTGLVFTGLFTTAMLLVHRTPALDASGDSYARFYSGGNDGALVTAGLYIVPFAGIAFLWFMMATRAHLVQLQRSGEADIPFGLQLMSGIVFIVMIFAGMAAAGSVALLTQFSTAPVPSADVARALSAAGYGLVFVYGAKVAGMYMITTTTLLRRARMLPRWLAWLGYLAAAVALLSWTFHPAFALILPGWVLMVSVVALVARARDVVEPVPGAQPRVSPEEVR